MVRADRRSGNLRSVFSRARSAALARTLDDARGRGRDAGVVHEIDAARGRSCLHVCLSIDPEKALAGMFRAKYGRRDAEFLSTASLQPKFRYPPGRLVRASASR